MRVCYVTMQFPVPSETFASNEVRKLLGAGVDISVHGLRSPGERAARLLVERDLAGVEVTHNSALATVRGLATAAGRPALLVAALMWLLGHSWARPGHLVRSLALLPRAFDVLREIGRRRPEVVHIYWSHYPSIVGYLVQRRYPEIIISISVAAYDLEMKYGGTVSVARRADVIRTLSKASVEQIVAFTGVRPERVEVIYNGVDMELVRSQAAGVAKVPRRLATVGRLRRTKGVYEVLEAFAQVAKKWPGATLRVLGDGPEAQRLRLRASELGMEGLVEFLGHVDQGRVIEELAEAEILLLLTKADTERLPNVIKEGMACRCVCITTPTTGIEELVVDERYGIIVPIEQPEAAAQAVDDVLSGRVDRSEVTRTAYRHIETNFDLNRTNVRYLDLWRRAQERRTRGGPARVSNREQVSPGLFDRH